MSDTITTDVPSFTVRHKPIPGNIYGVTYDLPFPEAWETRRRDGKLVVRVPATFTDEAGVTWRRLRSGEAIEHGDAYLITPFISVSYWQTPMHASGFYDSKSYRPHVRRA